MLNAGTVQATAELNMRRFSQGMKRMRREGDRSSKQVQGSLDGIGRKFTTISALAHSAFAVAMVRGAKSAINEFALLEGSMAKFEVVFGDQAKEMEAWVDTIRTRVPLANREIIQATAAMQDLLVPMGIARDQATGMTKEWFELAAALAAFNDVPVDQALEAIRSGIAGQSRPLRQFGIDVRETALQQTALEEGLIGAGEAMDETARQQALLIQAYNQSQDAIDGYEDQLGSTLIMEQNLGATFKDTLAVVGEGLDPAYKDLLTTLTQVLNITQELTKHGANLTDIWIHGAGALGVYIPSVWQAGGALIDFAENTTNAMKATREFNEEIESALSGDLGFDEMAQFASAISREMEKAAKQARSFGIEPENFQRFQELQGIAHALGAIMGNMAMNIDTSDANDAVEGTKKTIRDLQGEISELEESILDSFDPEQISNYKDQIEVLERAISSMMGELKPDTSIEKPIFDFDEALQAIDETMSSLLSKDMDFSEFFDTGSIGAMRQEIEKLNHELERTTDTQRAQELQAEIEGLNTAIQEMRFGVQGTGDDLEDATGAARFFSRTLADGLDQILFRARSVEDAISGIVRQLASRAFTTGIMGLLGGGFGAGGFAAAMFGGTFHTGGVVPGVGEKMINVQGGEAVLSRDQVKSLGTGSTQRIELTVNVRGGTELSGRDLRYVIDEQVRQSVRLQ